MGPCRSDRLYDCRRYVHATNPECVFRTLLGFSHHPYRVSTTARYCGPLLISCQYLFGIRVPSCSSPRVSPLSLIASITLSYSISFGDYIWPALVVWAFDRVLRAGRLLFNNRFGVSSNKHHCTATVELVSADTVRLTLKRRFNWRPGQHAYVILPTVSDLPTEAHPFTIASIPEPLENSKDRNVIFLIRGREGFTGRLREHAAANGICTVPALLDGPYGCPPDLTKFSTSILIAGLCKLYYLVALLTHDIYYRWFWRVVRIAAASEPRPVSQALHPTELHLTCQYQKISPRQIESAEGRIRLVR